MACVACVACVQNRNFCFCRKTLQPYFDALVKKVVVAAPVKDEKPVLNIVMGCNEVMPMAPYQNNHIMHKVDLVHALILPCPILRDVPIL